MPEHPIAVPAHIGDRVVITDSAGDKHPGTITEINAVEARMLNVFDDQTQQLRPVHYPRQVYVLTDAAPCWFHLNTGLQEQTGEASIEMVGS